MRLQLTRVVPPQFLRCQPARPLDETTLDLAEIHRRIQRVTAVVHDVHAQHAILAGQGIDDDFGHGRAVGIVEEWPPAEGAAVVIDLRRLVETRCR